MIKMGMLVLLFALCSSASGQFLREGTLTHFHSRGDYFMGGAESRGSKYTKPNELNPEAAIPILRRASSGVYFSVGAERGLNGAAIADNVSHLIQMDLVPEVVLYNQVNVILLKISASLPDLVHLRQATLEEWRQRLSTAEGLNGQERELFHVAETHKIYRQVEAAARERLMSPAYFQGSSYLKETRLFAKLQAMAKQGHIQVLTGNLLDTDRLRNTARQLTDLGLSISVCDLSNAWEVKYIGPSGVHTIVEALSPALRDDSIVLGTSVAHCLIDDLCFWNFHGVDVGLLRQLASSRSKMTELFGVLSRKSSGGLWQDNLTTKLKLLTLTLRDRQTRNSNTMACVRLLRR
jgi:hypothetical protein